MSSDNPILRAITMLQDYKGDLARRDFPDNDEGDHLQRVNENKRASVDAAIRALRDRPNYDTILDALRHQGLSIDGDNAYKRDLLDAVVGAMMLGRHNTNPPPAEHWAQRFWDIGREYAELPGAIVLPMPVMPEQPEDAIDDSWMDGYNAALRMREECQRAIEAAGLAAPAVVTRQPSGVVPPALIEALKYYANGDHLLLADPDAWDTCSGEPINFLHDDAGTASVEDGSIAKAALEALNLSSVSATIPMPAGLHPDTQDLVTRFATALAVKLHTAELKHGYSDGWKDPNWMDECRQKLIEHLAKGDPRDVAVYCAFLWHHCQSTSPKACLWTEDADSFVWTSACGNTWSFIDGGPEDNYMHFCNRCGGALVVDKQEDEPLPDSEELEQQP